MSRITDLRAKSQSGPDLYIDCGGVAVSLGTFVCLINEIIYAIEVARPIIDQLEGDIEDKAAPALSAKLALDYAGACLQDIFPSKDVGGRDILHKDGRIILGAPDELLPDIICTEKDIEEHGQVVHRDYQGKPQIAEPDQPTKCGKKGGANGHR